MVTKLYVAFVDRWTPVAQMDFTGSPMKPKVRIKSITLTTEQANALAPNVVGHCGGQEYLEDVELLCLEKKMPDED